MEYRLSDRQIKLLEAIIREYSESSEPVGSKTVVKKYSFKVSPATIRNEMASLLEDGYLEMMHTSSGRVPTSRAFRFFIEELMKEDDLPVLQEVAYKQRLWPHRFEFEKMLRQAVLSLADFTGYMSLAITEEGFVTYAGAGNLLDNSEFWDIEVMRSALSLVDKFDLLDKIFKDLAKSSDVSVIVGEELAVSKLDHCSLVFSPFHTQKKSGYISVLGPSRMKYPVVVPVVRHSRNLIEELSGSW